MFLICSQMIEFLRSYTTEKKSYQTAESTFNKSWDLDPS